MDSTNPQEPRINIPPFPDTAVNVVRPLHGTADSMEVVQRALVGRAGYGPVLLSSKSRSQLLLVPMVVNQFAQKTRLARRE